MKLHWSTRADVDLVEIWRQISVHSEIAADAALHRLQLRSKPLKESPEMGPLRGRRRKDVRQLVEGHVIFCRVSQAHVEILRVFDGRRELSDW